MACSQTKTRATWIATAEHLNGPWRWVSAQPITCKAAVTNKENGLHHENYQFIQIDDHWHLVTTDYPPLQPWLYALQGNPDEVSSWANWHDGRPLTLRSEKWNTKDCFNAIALWDHRAVDGRFYAIFGGKGYERQDEFNGTAGRKPWPRG